MAPTTPIGVPDRARAGDTWIWKIQDHSDYPQSEGWSLTYTLVGQSSDAGEVLTITPVFQTSGDDARYWLATVSIGDTAKLEATPPHSTYQIVGRMVGSGSFAGREETISTDLILVEPDPRTVDAGAWITHDERTLTIIRKALRGVLEPANASYSIGGRSVSKIPILDLQRLEGVYAARVLRRRTRQTGMPHRVRFGRA